MRIADIMSPNIFVVSLQSTIADAARLMREKDIGAMPVADGAKLVGVITDRDIAMRCCADGGDPAETKVVDAMSKKVFYCRTRDEIEKVAASMGELQLRRLPVTDDETRIVGIVTLGDIARTSNADAASAFRLISNPPPRPLAQGAPTGAGTPQAGGVKQ